MNYRTRSFATAVLIISTSLGHLTANAVTIAEAHVVSALSAKFETVAYTTTNILSSSTNSVATHVDSVDYLRVPFLELMDGLNAIGPTKAELFKKEYGALIMGAKNFTPPNGIGAIRSDKCYIGVPFDRTQFDIEAFLSPASREIIGGRPAWVWTMLASEDNRQPRTFYATQLPGSNFLMCNDRPDFETLAKSLPTEDRFTNLEASEMDWLTSSRYSYWVYRSVRRASVVAGVTPDVASLAFFADVGKRRGFVRVFSTEAGMRTAPNILPESKHQLFTPDTKGTWRAEILLERDEDSFDSVFYIFTALGFGAVL